MYKNTYLLICIYIQLKTSNITLLISINKSTSLCELPSDFETMQWPLNLYMFVNTSGRLHFDQCNLQSGATDGAAVALSCAPKQITLPGRLELPTLRLTASRSNQLSYGSK